MINEKDTKVNRVLWIYSQLLHGEVINKKEMAERFSVNDRTIQRDLDDIRVYLSENIENVGFRDITYVRSKNGYFLEKGEDALTKEDVLAVLKILLESRAFCKEELNHLTNGILGQVTSEQRKYVKDMIGNELLNYVPLQHNEKLLLKIRSLSEIIRKCEETQVTYIRMDGKEVKRIIKPVAIIFSEYYFYLIVYFKNMDSPTVLRIDRIKRFKSEGQKFYIKNSERFEEGEFRKRIQFMYSGKLYKIKFEFWGSSIEAVLDRIPTAKIIDEYDNKYLVEAEVYGKGIIMWILSQGNAIRLLEPKEMVEELMLKLKGILDIYI